MSNLRDQRIEVFGYSDLGTDGRIAPTYTLTNTYWGRHASPSGREATIAGQASQNVDAVFSFAAEAVIPPDGALRIPDGTVFKVTAVLPRRYPSGLKRWQVFGVYSDEQNLVIAAIGVASNLLLEDGSAFLLEDGNNLLLEAA